MHLFSFLPTVSLLLAGVLAADDAAPSSTSSERPFIVRFQTLLHREPYARRLRTHIHSTLALPHVQVDNLQPNPLTADELRTHLVAPERRLLYLGRSAGGRPGMLLAMPVVDDTWALITAHRPTSTLPIRWFSHGFVTVTGGDEVRQVLVERARTQEAALREGRMLSLNQVLDYVTALRDL